MTSGIFWGTLIVLWGISMIIETIFHIDIPFFRIAFACMVIAFGVRILTGSRTWGWVDTGSDAVFGNASFKGKDIRDAYSIVFGHGDVDLSEATSGDKRATVNTVFGASKIRVNPKQPVRVRASCAFGEVVMPDGRTSSFGETSWTSPAFKDGKDALEIKIDVAFGRAEVVTR